MTEKTGLQRLCLLDDIEDGGSRRFGADIRGEPTLILVVRRENRVFSYVNSCPHMGVPLDFVAGKFLNTKGTHIQCANHGALFGIENGICVYGPCVGDALKQIWTVVDEGIVYLGA